MCDRFQMMHVAAVKSHNIDGSWCCRGCMFDGSISRSLRLRLKRLGPTFKPEWPLHLVRDFYRVFFWFGEKRNFVWFGANTWSLTKLWDGLKGPEHLLLCLHNISAVKTNSLHNSRQKNAHFCKDRDAEVCSEYEIGFLRHRAGHPKSLSRAFFMAQGNEFMVSFFVWNWRNFYGRKKLFQQKTVFQCVDNEALLCGPFNPRILQGKQRLKSLRHHAVHRRGFRGI